MKRYVRGTVSSCQLKCLKHWFQPGPDPHCLTCSRSQLCVYTEHEGLHDRNEAITSMLIGLQIPRASEMALDKRDSETQPESPWKFHALRRDDALAAESFAPEIARASPQDVHARRFARDNLAAK